MQKKETTPTMPRLRATELRIGNLIEYLVYDELATPKEEFVENYVDIDDLRWLNENPDDNFYRPMKLTEDILKRFGFVKTMSWTYAIELKGNLKLVYYLGEKGWSIGFKSYSDFSNLIYTHQIQNLYFALTGQELTLQPEEDNQL
ncbi:hypothetical protein [Runella sp.]|uniref:hypothetical protein n=1 Tax=Runella sp. TaxID=1960881 RepID=UPI0030191F14